MSSSTSPSVAQLLPKERLEVLFGELAELAGQRNAIDGRVVDLVAEIDRDGLCGMTGAQSVAALVGWKLGTSSATANTIATIAHRLAEFPRCTLALREGRLSLDQVGVIAAHAPDGSDEHYADFAANATVNQLRTAIKLEPHPQPSPEPDSEPASESDSDPDADVVPDAEAVPESDVDPDVDGVSEPDVEPDAEAVPDGEVERDAEAVPDGEVERDAEADPGSDVFPESDVDPPPRPRAEVERSIIRIDGEQSVTFKITLPHAEAATLDAALQSHHDALIAQWKREHPDHRNPTTDGDDIGDRTPSFPTRVDAFASLVEAGWDAEVARRPQGQRTTVVVHLDVEHRIAALHLGPLLSDDDRRYLLCDATCEVWFHRDGRVIGSGRATRTVNRRLRRALEHRDRCCVVPGCGATRGLHAHHIRHWGDGGRTELANLVLVCPFHHRLHHRGGITITGDAYHLVVTDADGQALTNSSLARPPQHPPPDVAPCTGPIGERADWWWYDPYQPQPPPTEN